MKINILTFSKVYNRGANMQAYALKTYLENRGADVEFIDFQLPKSKTMNWRGHLFDLVLNGLAARFRKKTNFRFTPKYHSLADIRQNPPQADVYVVGSDQVWNPDLTKDAGPLAYFFDFLPEKCRRVSYAASIGKDKWNHDELVPSIQNCLKSFSAISVRENSAAKICEEKFGVKAEVVLDPTLLLNESDLRELIGHKTKVRNQTYTYLLYSGDETKDYVRAIHRLSGNKKSVGVHDNLWSKLQNFYTIRTWLADIASSTLVVTNSFHCMVMAVLLKKQFIVIPPYPGRETRMLSLLEKLGLSQYYVNVIDDMKIRSLIELPINYKEIERRLETLRSESENFINRNIL